MAEETLHPVLSCWKPGLHDPSPFPEPVRVQGSWRVWPPEGDPVSEQEPQVLSEDSPAWVTVLEAWTHRDQIFPGEAGQILSWFHQTKPENHHWRDVMENMGFNPSEAWYETYQELSTLPEGLRERIDQEELSVRVVRYLRELPENLKQPLYEAFDQEDFHLSVQETRQLVETGHRLDPDDYDVWIETLAELTAEDPRSRGQRFLQRMRNQAFPALQKKQQAFDQDLNQLELSGSIEVRPPKNFEGDYLDFSIRCHRDQDLNALAEELKQCQPLLNHV